ncbi:lipopolysaccharide biosynthesis protein [Sphingorhabdus sp.]|jgi:O-antigen/teichoic acid export membrane protein|uniref:lipopolysaccharide biosynthesis protein n=1 Tax=Sphingorhabdus sp. TaxID=1902408 RepID=UPI0037CBD004
MAEQKQGSGRRILRSGAWLFLPKTLSAVLSLIYLAVSTQTLGAADFGKFMLIFSFAQLIAGFTSFQTWQILIRYGTNLVHDKAHAELAELTWFCIILDLIGAGLTLFLAIFGAWLLAANQGWENNETIAVIVFTTLLVLSSRSTPTGLLRISDRFGDAALPDMLVPIIRLVGTGILVLTQPTIWGFLAIWLLSEFVPTIVVWINVLRQLKLPLRWSNLPRLNSLQDRFPGIGKFALWSNASSSFKLTSQQMVAVIVGVYVGAAAAGFFRLGYQLGQVFARIGDAVSMALFTEYARVAHIGGSKDAGALLSKMMKVSGVAAMLVLAIVGLAGEPIIVWLFGEEFVAAYPLVMILGTAAALQFATLGLEPALLTAGKAGRVMLCSLAGAIIVAILLIWLLPIYGEVGAAFAMLGAATVNAGLLIISYRQKILGKETNAAL